MAHTWGRRTAEEAAAVACTAHRCPLQVRELEPTCEVGGGEYSRVYTANANRSSRSRLASALQSFPFYPVQTYPLPIPNLP